MNLETLNTTTAVMDVLGGNTPVAQLTGGSPTAVSNWRGFKTFPSNTYVAMTEALRAIGKTAPTSLWGMKVGAEQESPNHNEPELTA